MSGDVAEGVVQDLRESAVDIACIRGDGDDVFVKAGGDVLLLDAMEANTLVAEIQETIQTTSEKSPVEVWEEHNSSFSYTPPQKPGGAWSEEKFEELCDRMITRQTQWLCDKCTGRGPFESLQRARRHVQKQHGSTLVDIHAPDEDDLAADSDDSSREDSHGLDEFGGGESA